MNNPQQIADLIRLQTTLKKISIRQMLKDIGLGVNSLSHMDNGSMPKSDNLGKVAAYLNCSVDYLLGMTDIPEVNKGNNIKTGDVMSGDNNHFNGNSVNIGSSFDINMGDTDAQELFDMIKQLSIVQKSEIILKINEMLCKK